MQLAIAGTGIVRCIYNDALDLHTLGCVSIRRGSYVEPDAKGQWHADLAPVNGPILGPFTRRIDALSAEHAWLLKHWL